LNVFLAGQRHDTAQSLKTLGQHGTRNEVSQSIIQIKDVTLDRGDDQFVRRLVLKAFDLTRHITTEE